MIRGLRPSTQVVGEVVSIDPASRRITIKTDQGATVEMSIRDNAPVLGVAPGAKDLKSAPRITLAEIAAGDRVAASTHKLGEKIEAGSIAVMARSELSEQRRREQAEWQARGAGGIVSATDPGAHSITLKSGQRTITVLTNEKTEFRRYAPDSVKFSDSRPSSFEEMKPGDQLRVLGDRSADGNTITAERVVSGAFRQVAGTIRSIDAATGMVTITDLATKQPFSFRVKPDSTLKSMPPQMAAMLARRLRPDGEQPGAEEPANTAQRRARPGLPARPEGAPAVRNGDVTQMLDRLPPAALTDLKPGEAVILSATSGGADGSATAIMLLSGVEPLLTASPAASRDLMSGWLSGGGDSGMDQ
jgi:Cu/Ag efflux protein CusF